MSYEETIAWMFTQLPMYQREGKYAYKANLNNTLRLDEHFHHPHESFKTIHVAGTNGKGSVSHMLASILQEAGYHTGLYTSPHLKDFRERIKVDGKMVEKDFVVDFITSNKAFFSELSPSFFEMTVAMAFEYFKYEKVDVAVIEVGLGGRLDSTNIIRPEISVITNISYDHTALLGNSLEAIAKEKAGIIKSGIPAVVGIRDKACDFVFEAQAARMGTQLSFASEHWDIKRNTDNSYNVKHEKAVFLEKLELPLKGYYQSKNLATVLETLKILSESGSFSPNISHIRKGIENTVKNTGLMGRWQILANRPYTVCDTGHNPDGIREIVRQIADIPYRRLHIVFGMVNDKDIDSILRLMPENALYYFCKASIPRAMDAAVLAAKASAYGLQGKVFESVADAYETAKRTADTEDMIYIGGSTFVVAEIV